MTSRSLWNYSRDEANDANENNYREYNKETTDYNRLDKEVVIPLNIWAVFGDLLISLSLIVLSWFLLNLGWSRNNTWNI